MEACLTSKYEVPGVYVVLDDETTLYVGETQNVRDRLEKVRNTETWMKFAPTSVRIWPVDNEHEQFGLRSYLVNKEQPLLNSELLREPAEA